MTSGNQSIDTEGGHPGAVGAGAHPGTLGIPRTTPPRGETDMKLKNGCQHNQ
jgi:hypothetical protein